MATPTNEDMRVLLARLESKMDHISEKLDKLDAASRANEAELRALDRRVTIIENTASNARMMIGAIWAVLGTAVIGFIAKLFGAF